MPPLTNCEPYPCDRIIAHETHKRREIQKRLGGGLTQPVTSRFERGMR